MAQVKHDVTKAVQKAIQDSTDATNGDVAAFLRLLLEQGFYVAEIKNRSAQRDGEDRS